MITLGVTGNTYTAPYKPIAIDCQWSINNLTAGEGPLLVGYSVGDLSVTEIGECLDSEVVGPSDIIQNERARRPVNRVGVFSGVAAEENLFNGALKRTTLRNFPIQEVGGQVVMFVRNQSGAALTTGAVITGAGTLYGRWA